MRYGRSSRVVPTLTVAMATVWLTAACSQDKDRVAYCVDQQNEVVPQSYCDTSNYHGGVFPYYIWYGSPGRSLSRGNVVPNGQRFSATDTSARSKIGLSSSGSIAGSGDSKSGGFGTKVGKGSGGGSGGHAGSGGHGSGS